MASPEVVHSSDPSPPRTRLVHSPSPSPSPSTDEDTLMHSPSPSPGRRPEDDPPPGPGDPGPEMPLPDLVDPLWPLHLPLPAVTCPRCYELLRMRINNYPGSVAHALRQQRRLRDKLPRRRLREKYQGPYPERDAYHGHQQSPGAPRQACGTPRGHTKEECNTPDTPPKHTPVTPTQ